MRFYNAGGGDDPNKSDMHRALGLADEKIGDLVAFLESLTGDDIIVQPPDMPEYAVLP